MRAKDCLTHQVREAMEWAEEYGVVEEDSSPYGEIANEIADEIADPLRALAAMLEAAFPDVSSPLCFGVSLAMVDPIPSADQFRSMPLADGMGGSPSIPSADPRPPPLTPPPLPPSPPPRRRPRRHAYPTSVPISSWVRCARARACARCGTMGAAPCPKTKLCRPRGPSCRLVPWGRPTTMPPRDSWH